MSQSLPTFIEPLRFAETRRELSGTLGLDRMDRLAESLYDGEGEVVLSLSFDRDRQGIPYAEAVIEARLRLTCQRCLGPWETRVLREVRLAFTRHEADVQRLAEYGYEPVVMARQQLLLREMVEDELLLALPMIPRHPVECRPKPPEAEEAGTPRRSNPFAILARLKDGGSEPSEP